MRLLYITNIADVNDMIDRIHDDKCEKYSNENKYPHNTRAVFHRFRLYCKYYIYYIVNIVNIKRKYKEHIYQT